MCVCMHEGAYMHVVCVMSTNDGWNATSLRIKNLKKLSCNVPDDSD